MLELVLFLSLLCFQCHVGSVYMNLVTEGRVHTMMRAGMQAWTESKPAEMMTQANEIVILLYLR